MYIMAEGGESLGIFLIWGVHTDSEKCQAFVWKNKQKIWVLINKK